jgi:hypothetical protein
MQASGQMGFDFCEFDVEAASARIAEYKVLRNNPGIVFAEATSVRSREPLTAETKGRIFRVWAGCTLLVFLSFRGDSFSSLINFGTSLLVSTVLAFVVVLIAVFLGEYLVGEDERQRALAERECAFRIGYRCGWQNCEKRKPPLFVGWDKEEDNVDWPDHMYFPSERGTPQNRTLD